LKVLFIVPYPIEAASTRYRVDQYLLYLHQNGIEPTVSRFINSGQFFNTLYQPGHTYQKTVYFSAALLRRLRDLLSLKSFDIIFIQREALPLGPAIFERLASLSRRPIIFDFDDAIYLPHSSEANRWISWIRYPEKVADIVKYSSHVIVGNQTLREYVLQFHQRVSIIPTSINTDQYVIRPEQKSNTGSLTIGWVGSGTTVQYLHLLDNVFRQLAQRHQFRLCVVGGEYQLPGLEVICRPWHLRNEIYDLHSFDIGLMPLPDNRWTRGKGGFKAIQYMGVGIPVVASPVGINSEIIKHNENGLLAASDEEWHECLSQLLEDATLRRRLGLVGRATVEAHYSVQANAPKLLDILLSI
jgi:glycosyltransferase involved in cell wall biosynthesis